MSQAYRTTQRGFFLVTVVVILAVLASVAMLLSTNASMDNAILGRHAEVAELDYVAEAGMAHAKWQLTQNVSCSAYLDLPTTSFGAHNYAATFSPSSGSPVTITANAALANGAQRSAQYQDVPVYQAATTTILQPDATTGKDTFLYQWKSTWNYGSAVNLRVENRVVGDWSNALLEFNVSAIPSAAKIISATLELDQSLASASGGDFSVHRVTSAWIEGNLLNGAGSPNWTERESGANWATPGGDYDPAPAATISVPAGLGKSQWDITQLVQKWVSGEAPSLGLAVVPASFGSDALFSSSDTGAVAKRPKLTISYACDCSTSPVNPVELVLEPGAAGKDNFLEGESGKTNLNNGNLDEIKTSSETGKEYRTLLQFELSAVPSNAIVLSADVELYLHSKGSTDVVEAHQILQDWTESGSTWATYDGVNPWIAPGGDYDSEIVDTFVTDSTGLKSLDIAALAQAWVNGSQTNYGLMLLSPTSPGGTENKYHSSDKIGEPVPKLTITYTCPCGICSAGGGGTPPPGFAMLLVVDDPGSLSTQDSDRKALVESFGYTVTLIDDGASLADFQAATAGADIAYVSSSASASSLDTKLVSTNIGVVNEASALVNEFGFAAQNSVLKSRDALNVLDNTHYITSPFPTGLLTITSSVQSIHLLSGSVGDGFEALADAFNVGSIWLPTLGVLETGAALYGGGSAAGRRVLLPWAVTGFDVNALNTDGRTILQRAFEWAAGAGAPTLGPIAHWKMDETSGLSAFDSVGNNDGVLVNGPSWAAGVVNGGLNFDGGNDYVDVSIMNPMSYNDFTVSAWYKSADTGVSDDEYIFEHNDNFVNEVTFGPTDDGTDDRIRFGFAHGGSGTWDPHYGTSDIVDQQWHHVVGVRSAGRIKLYVDGVEETDEVDAHAGVTVTIDGDGPFIGDLPGNTEQVHGTLDDVRLYDRALSAAEIADQYSSAAAGGGPGAAPGVLGFDTIFASSQNNVRRLQIGTQVTLPEDETADSITAYVGNKDARNVRYAIYSDVGGEPGSLIAETPNALTTVAMQWLSIDLPATALSAGTYWLALSFHDSNQTYHYEAGGQTRYMSNRATDNGFVTNWGSSSFSDSRKISIYATYIP